MNTMVYGIRHNRFTTFKAKFVSGVTIVKVKQGRLEKSQIPDSSIRAVSWLWTFTDKVEDHMPMKEEIHLPSCLTKADVYTLAKDDLTQRGLQCCKVSTFYSIWSSSFRNVKIPCVGQREPNEYMLHVHSNEHTNHCLAPTCD